MTYWEVNFLVALYIMPLDHTDPLGLAFHEHLQNALYLSPVRQNAYANTLFTSPTYTSKDGILPFALMAGYM